MSSPRILVAGVGNVFLGDDGFGVEVVRRLAQRRLPSDVRLVDFGIRGFDLAYALLDGYESVILVDAARRGGAPGTLYVIEPDPARELPAVETHGMDPAKVLELVRVMGGGVKRLRVVGCEPAYLGEDGACVVGLSEAVREAVDPAVRMIESMFDGLRSGTADHA